MNQAARRKPGREQNWVAPGVGLGLAGQPADPVQPGLGRPGRQAVERAQGLVWWDEEQGKWTGHDVPDFVADRPPSYRPPAGATGVAAISGIDPFIMQADGKAWLFAPAGLVDGPLPAHYEPQESPFRNPLYRQQHNPVRQIIAHPDNRFQPSGDEPGSEVFPYVTTTYRLTEHHTAGGMSRFLPYLAELQPAFFCEVSPELAAERGLEHLGWATIVTRAQRDRGPGAGHRADDAAAVQGRTVHQIGLPWHWGPNGLHHRGRGQRAVPPGAGSERAHPGGQGDGRATSSPAGGRAGRRCATWSVLPAAGRHHRRDRDGGVR